jgi:hypothetical protein
VSSILSLRSSNRSSTSLYRFTTSDLSTFFAFLGLELLPLLFFALLEAAEDALPLKVVFEPLITGTLKFPLASVYKFESKTAV